ncbi:TSL-kinase interacting protein 1 isoform X1 [Arabidopsis lyrata subsp. lyrata]|uniref:TSL-kinase interacting protein 1 isoform X1 n=1 Tax=Arabidopsis lyrata subsp. lyrata TaxID=81972 RepID=UPI000A29A9CE|nr:TSL-kinase interacting protein 1 isoform X1 [Arabidopsis lyrata subsp. lyrata]|eukprot:XP_020884578.1 TSL-kinase interacting protein 1 isoform X1 [Arabidopsis lyrata subsp. lyrata]
MLKQFAHYCEMQAELKPEGPNGEGRLSNQNSNPNLLSSASITVAQFPAKKPTRQWAAWTHQEEESFFTALRQVGKNFEKITSRVQSKNKDQVRHYYYRLVRRMNKLLGPELSLDAKNPKDTNAAMLRWWSLLEKYSCKASKLHLKPRRFKLFIEALEHQLLKDRRKSIRKRACQGENLSSASLGNISSHSRERGLDNRPFKLILSDGQNVKKLGPGRASTKHGESLGVILGEEKEDTAFGRGGRQRRKQAGYRKWEKAAIDGVSLVADAAEHLERTSIDKDMDDQTELGPSRYLTGKSPLSLCSSGDILLSDTNMQFSAKLKLQLFPIDECTRRSLEMDKHNPHLELTLSNRKKISSVLEHLNRKWGSASCATGELLLFPYNARKETVTCHQRWTHDSFLSAAEVHSMVGSPSVFRLRYGWFVHDASGSIISQVPTSDPCPSLEDDMNVDGVNEVNMLLTESGPLSVHSTAEQATSVEPSQGLVCASGEIHDHPAESRDDYEAASTTITPLEHLSSGNAQSAGEWADSLTNISIGDLLSEVPDDIDSDGVDPPATEGSHYLLRDVPFASDSFDAAIAAHILRHQNKPSALLPLTSGSSSLWDDEETRDAFSFQKNRLADSTELASVASHRVNGEPSQLVEVLSGDEGSCNPPDHGDPMEEGPTDPQTMDSPGKTPCGLADVYWPDSLGPLDLDIRSSKYTEDLILSESLGGLSRLIATSLDAFQNCSLFGFDNKKDKSNMV